MHAASCPCPDPRPCPPPPSTANSCRWRSARTWRRWCCAAGACAACRWAPARAWGPSPSSASPWSSWWAGWGGGECEVGSGVVVCGRGVVAAELGMGRWAAWVGGHQAAMHAICAAHRSASACALRVSRPAGPARLQPAAQPVAGLPRAALHRRHLLLQPQVGCCCCCCCCAGVHRSAQRLAGGAASHHTAAARTPPPSHAPCCPHRLALALQRRRDRGGGTLRGPGGAGAGGVQLRQGSSRRGSMCWWHGRGMLSGHAWQQGAASAPCAPSLLPRPLPRPPQ